MRWALWPRADTTAPVIVVLLPLSPRWVQQGRVKLGFQEVLAWPKGWAGDIYFGGVIQQRA